MNSDANVISVNALSMKVMGSFASTNQKETAQAGLATPRDPNSQ
jgi:hypothetical protein